LKAQKNNLILPKKNLYGFFKVQVFTLILQSTERTFAVTWHRLLLFPKKHSLPITGVRREQG